MAAKFFKLGLVQAGLQEVAWLSFHKTTGYVSESIVLLAVGTGRDS